MGFGGCDTCSVDVNGIVTSMQAACAWICNKIKTQCHRALLLRIPVSQGKDFPRSP